jgi:predicted nucleotidyltransferase
VSSRRASACAAIATVARGLREEKDRVVFVGGTVTALYPLEGGSDVRPTIDVDCVVDVATTSEYYAFVARLRTLGFGECADEGAPLCRLVYAEIRVDVVATSATAIGPTNRWYRDAVVGAAVYPVATDVRVFAITPPYFVATKLEAFRGRGGGDYQASHDLEDVLAVIAGLPDLRRQLAHGASTVERAVREELRVLGTKEAFVDAIRGHFEADDAGQVRAALVVEWLTTLRE